jgi:flagellar basal-body rod protein FlgB
VWDAVDLFSEIRPLHQALDYHLERHNVLVSNVSNVDTPNYVPRDLARVEGFNGVLQVTLNRTNASHIALPEAGAPVTGRVFEDPTAGAGNDKNFVSLDREAAKVAANQVRYDVISTLVAAQLGDLSFAANDGH